VVSVTTYRDAGFLPHAYVNFLCLLGWSPKDDREKMSVEELAQAFTFEGINRDNAVVNFQENEPFDPKALWLNAEYIRAMGVEQLSEKLTPFVCAAGYSAEPGKMLAVTRLLRERIRLLSEVTTVGDFFFRDQLAPYDSAELIPQKSDAATALKVLGRAKDILAKVDFTHDALDTALRGAAEELKIKAGQMFQPIRVAVCGRKAAPPLFETLEVLGRETCLERIAQAMELLSRAPEKQ
jgi:glutamyl-tRNA synthetase